MFDLWTAYDKDENRTASLRAIYRLRCAGIPKSKIRCYVLIGFDGESRSEAEGRLRDVYNMGAYPFAQLYDKFKGAEEEKKKWKRLARTWSLPAAFKCDMKLPGRDGLDGLI